VAAGLTLVAGVLLLVVGIAGALTRRRLAGASAQWLGKRGGGGQPPDVGTIAMIILVVGVVVAVWGATLIVWGWLETDFIEAADAR
jgi:hypothetical protein